MSVNSIKHTESLPKIDIHLNLAGTGTNQSGCSISSDFRHRPSFEGLRLLYGISRKQLKTSIDRDWVVMIVDLIQQSQEIDYGVVLGFDQVYDRQGHLLTDQKQMVVPANWVFQVCEEYPGLLPCPGLHPYRLDALDELDRLAEKGAVMIKWLPPAQGIDASDTNLIPFYQKLSQYQIPILVHTGSERTFRSYYPDYIQVERLRLPLEHGVPIIAAHTATPGLLTGEPRQWSQVKAMLHAYPHFWVENSGICHPGRFFNLPQLAEDSMIKAKTLYGSDWPIPSNAVFYLKQLGFKKVYQLEKIKNLLDRDVAIKRAFGFSDETLTRAHQVLANLQRWTEQPRDPAGRILPINS